MTRAMPTLLLMAVLTACDREPKTRYELASEQRQKEEAEKAAKMKRLEGKTFIAVKTSYGAGEWVHGRQDCPEVVEAQKEAQEKDRLTKKPRAELVSVRVTNGRIVDEQGFFHDGYFYFCSKCVQ